MNSTQIFQKITKIIYIPSRQFIKNTNHNWPGGIKYFGFTYYPRFPDFKDPPYEPTRLFMIKRIKPFLTGCTKWEKTILAHLNIDGKMRNYGHINIVKNIPETNARLYKIKHLIEIIPIKFVNGVIPKDKNFRGAYLKDNGEFIVSEDYAISPERLLASKNFIADQKMLEPALVKEHLERRRNCPFEGVTM